MFQNRLTPLYRIIRGRFSIQVSGLENIRRDQNYIFAMNHQSVMDIPITYTVLAPRTDRKINLFLSHYFYHIFLPLTLPLEAISINMNKGKSERISRFNRAQLEKGIQKIRQGNNILIYPEGGMDGARESTVARGETGAVRLAVRTGTPLIPIGIRGSNHAYPFTVYTNNPFTHKREIPVEITVGQPISYGSYAGLELESYSEANRSTLRTLTEDLMVVLSRLSGLPQVAGA